MHEKRLTVGTRGVSKRINAKHTAKDSEHKNTINRCFFENGCSLCVKKILNMGWLYNT